MSNIITIDVLIIGSGPAGSSTALHLVRENPAWAERIMVVDKAIHPREKVCGGGVTRLGEDVLTGLGLKFETPFIYIREMRLVYKQWAYAFRGEPVFRVVRRDEFDHWLLCEAEARGVTVRQGEAVREIIPHDEYIKVITDRATIHAKVLVGADGSRSFVRRALDWEADRVRYARMLEVLTPEQAEQHIEFREGVAVFDFTPMPDGVQGYYWDFPSLIDGQPFMNRGLFDSRACEKRPRAALKAALRTAMQARQRTLDAYPLKGHPLRWLDPRRSVVSQPRVILVGDAAGTDPMLGEGISFALAYGEVARNAITEAFASNDFSFASYKQHILAHRVTGQLVWRGRLARMVYALRSTGMLRLFWAAMPLIVRGLVWYDPYYIPVKEPRLRRVQ